MEQETGSNIQWLPGTVQTRERDSPRVGDSPVRFSSQYRGKFLKQEGIRTQDGP